MTINFSVDNKKYEFNWNRDASNCIKNLYSETSKRTLTTQKLYEIVSSLNREERFLSIFAPSYFNYFCDTIKILIPHISETSIDNEICKIIKLFNHYNYRDDQCYNCEYIFNTVSSCKHLIKNDFTIMNIILLGQMNIFYIHKTINFFNQNIKNITIDNIICDIIKLFKHEYCLSNCHYCQKFCDTIHILKNSIQVDKTIVNMVKTLIKIKISTSTFIKILIILCEKFKKIGCDIFCVILGLVNKKFSHELIIRLHKYIIIKSLDNIKQIINYIDNDKTNDIRKLFYYNMTRLEKIILCNRDNGNEYIHVFKYIDNDNINNLYNGLINSRHKSELMRIILSKNPDLDEIVFYQLIQKLNFYDSFKIYKY